MAQVSLLLVAVGARAEQPRRIGFHLEAQLAAATTAQPPLPPTR